MDDPWAAYPVVQQPEPQQSSSGWDAYPAVKPDAKPAASPWDAYPVVQHEAAPDTGRLPPAKVDEGSAPAPITAAPDEGAFTMGARLRSGLPAQPTAAELAPNPNGVKAAAESGIADSLRSVAAAPGAVAGQQMQPIAPAPYKEPLHYGDLLHPDQAAPKIAYQLSSSMPSMAGGILGGVAGEAVAPESGPIAPLAGGAAGAGAVTAVQTLAPYYAEEMHKPGATPDKAFDAALARAGQSGAFSSAGWALFGLAPFASAAKNILGQAFVVQPGVGAAERATENVEQGKPAGEGVGEAALNAGVGTAVPMVGHAVVHAAPDLIAPQPAAAPLHADAAALTDMAAAHQALQPSPAAQAAKQTLVNIAAGKPADAPAEPTPQAGPWDAFPVAEHGAEPPAGAQQSAPASAVPAASAWQQQNRANIVDYATKANLIPRIDELARAGKTAAEISADIGGKLDANEVRMVRDHLGIAAAGPQEGLGISIPSDATNEIGQTPEPQQSATLSKPETVAPYTMVRPGDLTLDPKRFQYKASDENGVTGVLQGVTRWDSNLADPIDAYRDTDGKLYVVNGHQRTDLANRAVAAGQPDVQMAAKVYDAADGYTPEQMRYLGAYRNIAQGSGTAIDAAKIMRAPVPEGMVPPELPPKSAIVQQAQGLKNLSDEAFGAAINGVIPAPYAAEVGRQITDPKQQMAAIQVLHQADPPNVEQARIMVADVKNSGFLDGHQEDMFGTQAFAQSLFPERAKVLAQALQTLRGNKRVFQAAVQGEDALTSAGNRMDTAANQKGQTENEQLVDLLQRAATTRGPISDALSVAARDVAGGKQVRGAAGDFLTQARAVIRRGPEVGVEPGAAVERTGPAGESGEGSAGLETIPVHRQGPENFDFNASRPQGLYVSLPHDPATFASPHAEDAGAVAYRGSITPKNPLLIKDQPYVDHARFGALGKGPASSGIYALRELLPRDEFRSIMSMDKEQVAAVIKKQFPDLSIKGYGYDAYEMAEVLGAQLAKQAGHDAIMRHDPAFPEFSEGVILDPKIAKWDQPSLFSAREAGPATEGPPADHPEFQAVAEHMMRFTGVPESVTLKLFERLGQQGPDGRGTADGAYADKLVRFALDTPPDQVSAKLFHEIVHALRDQSLGLLSPVERTALDAGANRYLATGNNRAEIVSRYTTNGKPPPANVVHEEAIARMAEEAITKALARPTLGQRVAARLVNFVRGLGQALCGQGFKTADDVFHAIMQGRMEGRAEGAHPAPDGQARVAGDMEARRPLITDKAGLEREGQGALFGRSAVQAQAARDAAEGRGRGEQKPMDEGLFAPKETAQPSLAPHGQAMHDTAAELIRWGKQNGREALRTYDALTDKIVHQTTGKERTVGFTPEMNQALDKPTNALVFQHNHPRSTALSPDDIAQLIYPGISWAVAHGHDGSFSAAKAPDGTTPTHETGGTSDPELYRLQVAMNRRHAAANTAATGVVHDLMRAGKFTADETRGIWNDIVNRMMAIRGHIDYISSHVVPPVLRDALHEYAKRNSLAADNDQIDRFTQSVQPSEGIARVAEDARRLAQQRAGGDGGNRADAQVHSGPQAQPASGRPPLVRGEQGRLFSLRDDGRDVAERQRAAAQISIDLTQPRGRASLEPIKAIVRNAQEILSPTSLPGAKPTEFTVRKNAAEQARSFARTVADLSDMRDAMNRLPVEEQHAFTDRMEAGEKQATPELQAVADMLRTTFDGWAKKIQSLGKGYLEDTIENYAPHIWGNYREWKAGLPTDPNADPMDRAIAGAMSKSPIRGSGAFLKQRTFATQREGMEAGLIPVSSNPVDLAMIKLREMQKMYHGTRMAEEMKQTGIAQWVPVSEEGAARGAGWVKLDDTAFKPTTTEFGGRTEFGSYWAPAGAARIFNNYTSRGISDSPIYGAIRASGNALNQLQLGLSGFHATFVTMDSAISKVAMGLRQVAGGVKRLDPALAAKGAGNVALGLPPLVPVAAGMTAYRGGQLRKAILYPEAATPEMRKIADLAMQGGARVAQQQIFRADARGSFVRNMGDFLNGHIFREIANTARNEFANHGPILGAITTPIHMASRLIETTMQPLMELYVPRAKLGVFYDMANDWAQQNPDATPEATADAMTKAWDSVDNRMGQMVYDNLFWNKTAKDLAFISTRSVGWNLGTIRELAGAGVDSAAQAAKLAQLRAPEITHRMAYAMAMPLVTGMLGGTMTYLLTGQAPQDLLDYFYPKKSDGTRLAIPGYIKDVIDYTHAPLQTLANKTHPLLSMAQQLANNRDYYGGIIRDPQRDGVLRPYLEYLTNQIEPFALRAMQKETDQGATSMEKVAAFWGFQPAPAAIANPEKGESIQRKQDKQAYRKRMREPGRVAWPDWVP